ncbi:MAG: DNA polymerase III subunit beta [Prevotella sp.]|jgi:DNA polymerase-3 subunit beta|nr:DNA polymerase III subunit beta [Prevotella sp.]MBO6235011.1 DNA polymerase III subunit beta [Prevotella sp.]MBP3750598.1 DNA polymerase III subunit beta [Prevotella sp.]MBQ2534505.1 DNA polymerase III subunit beta [Prevotella sp.]MBQ4041817.1 DNA polymerase III subunit beta [Prevotella sp.]
MTFTLSSSVLSNKLGILAKVINSKNSLSILDSFLFSVDGETLTVTASDNNNMMKCFIPLTNASGQGAFCVSNKLILNAVKELAEQPLTFEVDDNSNGIKIVYQNGSYSIMGQSADEYPNMQQISDGYTETQISASALANNIQRTLFATANDELRMVMNGIYFDLKEDCLNLVASDGHKMVRNMLFECKASVPASFILPKKPAGLLRSVLSTDDETPVTIKFNNNNAEITFPDGLLSCRLIEGRYPNYASVIPTDNPNIVTVDRKALISALRRVLPFASESTQLIKLRLEMNSLQLNAEDIDFATSAYEDVICEYGGVPMSIGFKGSALTEILNNLSSDDVVIELADPSRAGVIRPSEQPENEDVLMLIMPMLLND